MIRKLSPIFLLALSASFASATWTTVADRAALGANDVLDWNQYTAGSLGSSFTGTTAGGIGFTVSSVDDFTSANDGGNLTKFDAGFWATTLDGSLPVLYNPNERPSDILIEFDTAIYGLGFEICSNVFGEFSGNMGVWTGAPFFDNSAVGYDGEVGISGGDRGTAPFLGGLDDTGSIKAVYITASMVSGDPTLGFGINNLSLVTEPVPEPASMTAMALGLAAIARRRRKA